MDKDKDTEEYKEMMKQINELSQKITQSKDIKQDGLFKELKGLDALRGSNKKGVMAALLFNSLKNKTMTSEEDTSIDNTEK